MNIPKHLRLLPALLLVLSFVLDGCAGSAPPPASPEAPSAETDDANDGKEGGKQRDPKKRNEQRPANRFL